MSIVYYWDICRRVEGSAAAISWSKLEERNRQVVTVDVVLPALRKSPGLSLHVDGGDGLS